MAGVAPLCAWGRSVERRTNDSLGRRSPVRVGLVPLYGVSPYHGKIFPPARVALARSRKFTPFPVRMFFRGVSRQLAANRGELPQLAANRGLNPIQYNPIQYSAPASPKQHYILSLRVQPPAGLFCKAWREPKRERPCFRLKERRSVFIVW